MKRDLLRKHAALIFMLLSIIVSILWVSCAFVSPWFLLSENQQLYLFSTQAQVVGAIYGLTVTGYMFLRNNQDKQKSSQPEIEEAIAFSQLEERKILIFLTIFSMLSVLLSVFTLFTFDNDYRLLRVLVKNSASSFFLISIFWFACFILYVLRLDKIEKASLAIKQEIDYEEEKNYEVGSDATNFDGGMVGPQENSLSNFLYMFNKMEKDLKYLLNKKMSKDSISYKSMSSSFDYVYYPTKKRMYISAIVKALSNAGILEQKLEKDINEIIRYRNALVHGQDLNPSTTMVYKIRITANKVEQLLAD